MVAKNISHYKIIEELGKGGMGEVYLAEDLKLQRKSALKFLSSNLVNDEEKIRFINEARVAASLNHPNICTVYEVDEVDGKPFISMEYIEGESLLDRIKLSEIPIEEAVNIILQIADGLREASNNGIIHRDIKTANILLSQNGQTKITDFGLAKFMSSPIITRDGATIGTVAYISPEQARGDEVDSRTDIWSLGVVFYEMLTGKLPFRGEFDQAIIYSILNEKPVPFDNEGRKVPQKLQELILKMLKNNASDRYQSFNEVIDDIKIFAEEFGINLHPVRILSNKKRSKIQIIKSGAPVIFIILCISLYLTLWKDVPNEVNIKLCVFPFETIGSDDDEIFVQGLYSEVVNRLSFINGLDVVSTKKARIYDKMENKFEVIEEDNINYWIEAEAQFFNIDSIKTVNANFRIIDTKNSEIIWAGNITKVMGFLPQLYGELAQHIAKNFDIEILEDKRAKIIEPFTLVSEADELWLKSREIRRRAQANPNLKERIVGELAATQFKEQAVQLDPENARMWRGLYFDYTWLYSSGLDRSVERKQKAIKAFNKAKQLAPDKMRFQEVIHEYRVNRNKDKSYSLLKKLHKESPNDGMIILWLGIIEFRLGLWEEAIKKLSSLDYKNQDNGDVPFILGFLYTYTRLYREADKEYDISLENQPGFIDAVVEKSHNHILWTGNIEAAKSVWEIVDDNANVKTHYFWLYLYRLEKNYNSLLEMIKLFESDLDFRQYDCIVKQNELALVYYLMNKNEEAKLHADSAIVILNKALLKNPTDEIIHTSLGFAHALAGNREKSIEHNEMALKICPVSFDAGSGPVYEHNFAKSYAILGMKNEAIKKLKYLLSIPSYVSKEYLKIDPLYDNLRNEDQFIRLISD